MQSPVNGPYLFGRYSTEHPGRLAAIVVARWAATGFRVAGRHSTQSVLPSGAAVRMVPRWGAAGCRVTGPVQKVSCKTCCHFPPI